MAEWKEGGNECGMECVFMGELAREWAMRGREDTGRHRKTREDRKGQCGVRRVVRGGKRRGERSERDEGTVKVEFISVELCNYIRMIHSNDRRLHTPVTHTVPTDSR